MRLFESAKSILLEIPYTLEELTELVAETIRKKPIIRWLYPFSCISWNRQPWIGSSFLPSCYRCHHCGTIGAFSQLSFYETGIPIITVATRRNRPDVLSPQVKSLNYLNNILVKIEAKLAGVLEALMLNEQGYVAEGSGDNVFLVKGNKLITPPSSAGALEGITRNAIMEIGKKSLAMMCVRNCSHAMMCT
ncbi:hypothetical protein GCM10020331_069380 [Ectobacillus funiculus]